MNCLIGIDRELADSLLAEIADNPNLEFLGTNEERDFVANAMKRRHIHWPVLWLETLQDIHDKICD
jgi:hypothetical protein